MKLFYFVLLQGLLVCDGGHVTRSVSFSLTCRSCGRRMKEMVCVTISLIKLLPIAFGY